MKIQKGFLLLLFTILFQLAIAETIFARETSRLATFNLAWLHQEDNTGLVKRSDEDFQAIADSLVDLKSPLVAVQEINDVVALQERIFPLHPSLQNFEAITTGFGAQETGVIWDRRKVYIEALDLPPEFLSMTRKPFLFAFAVGRFTGRGIVVHLKAGQGLEDQRRRLAEFKTIMKWIEDEVPRSRDKDIVVLGDFNEEPELARQNLCQGCFLVAPNENESTLVSGAGRVDYFIFSNAMRADIPVRVAEVGSDTIYNLIHSFEVSDHFPAQVEFRK